MALKRTKPPETLLRELIQVAEHADKLTSAISSANALPAQFPIEPTLTLCGALSDLPLGTAEGCRLPLEYARSRLPAIRREFLPIDRGSVATIDDSAPDRGSHLDAAILALLGAVSTALDEYRYLATSSFSDVDVEDYSETFDDINSRNSVVDRSLRTRSYIRSGVSEAGDLFEPDSETGSTLIRSLHDAEQLNELARAEVSMSAVVVRWLRMLSKGLAQVPTIIRKLGEAVEIGADVAQTGWARWDNFWSGLREFGLNEIKETGLAFQDIADILEKKRRTRIRNPETPSADELLEFGEWLNKFVEDRDTLGKGVAVTLIGAEIFQRHGCQPNEYAKRLKQKNLKTLVQSTNNIRVVGEGSDLFAVRMSKADHERRRDKVAIVVADLLANEFPQLLERFPYGVEMSRLNRFARSKIGDEYRYLWGTEKPTSFRQFLLDYCVFEMDQKRVTTLFRR